MVLLVCKYEGVGAWVIVVVEKLGIGGGHALSMLSVGGIGTASPNCIVDNLSCKINGCWWW